MFGHAFTALSSTAFVALPLSGGAVAPPPAGPSLDFSQATNSQDEPLIFGDEN